MFNQLSRHSINSTRKKNPLNSIFSCCLARLFTLQAVVPHFVVNYSGNKTMRNAAAKHWSTKWYLLVLVRKLFNISSFFWHSFYDAFLIVYPLDCSVVKHTCTTRTYIIIFAPARETVCLSEYWVWVIIVNYWLSSTSANSQSAGTFSSVYTNICNNLTKLEVRVDSTHTDSLIDVFYRSLKWCLVSFWNGGKNGF